MVEVYDKMVVYVQWCNPYNRIDEKTYKFFLLFGEFEGLKGCGKGDTNSNEGVDVVERWKTSTTRHVLVSYASAMRP